MKKTLFVQGKNLQLSRTQKRTTKLRMIYQGISQKTNSLRTSQLCPFIPETYGADRQSKRAGRKLKQKTRETTAGGDCLPACLPAG
jgi:hypothetical protein